MSGAAPRLCAGLSPSKLRATIRAAVGAALLPALAILVSTSNAQTLPADAQPIAIVPTDIFNGWFDGTPKLDGKVTPADSLNFLENSNLDNVSFYRWSERMFLWLTTPIFKMDGSYDGIVINSIEFFGVSKLEQGKRKFISNVRDTYGNPIVPSLQLQSAETGPHGLPVVIGQRGGLYEVLRMEGLTPKFFPELRANGNDKPLTEGQAGTLGVLLTQSGSPVYYMISVNDFYTCFLTGTKRGEILPSPTHFPKDQTDWSSIVKFANSCKAKKIHDWNLQNRNALCIAVKTSWVEADLLPDRGAGYIKMEGKIPTYDKSNPKRWVYTGESKTPVPLAMIGMNIAGSVNGHPEMIWTSFEHFGNTPNASYEYNSTDGCTKTVCQNTTGNWLFCRGGAGSHFNWKRQRLDGGDIISNPCCDIGPSNAIRFKPFGAACNQRPNKGVKDSAESNTQIISMNNSVRKQLSDGDVRRNYFMLGATWTDGGQSPDMSFKDGKKGSQGVIIGTSQFANSTMETFTQYSSSYSPSGSCFSCHTSDDPKSPTTHVSRIFCDLEKLF
jgi:hypothetical protein